MNTIPRVVKKVPFGMCLQSYKSPAAKQSVSSYRRFRTSFKVVDCCFDVVDVDVDDDEKQELFETTFLFRRRSNKNFWLSQSLSNGELVEPGNTN